MKRGSIQSHCNLVIEEHVNAARCSIVATKPNAIAAERDCLVRLLIDDAPMPLAFKRIQAAMMQQGWNDAAIQGCGVRRSSREAAWAPAAGSGRAAGHGAAAKAGL